MTELFGMVIILEDGSGTAGVRSLVLGTSLKAKLASFTGETCNGGNEIAFFQRREVDPSSAFWDPQAAIGISIPG